jgi:glyoxylase-like metal-dependent hydrolase (beta-lactamase superfamily II)
VADEEVASGVYRLGSRWVNFYLVVDGDEAVLIDAGYPRYLAQLEARVGGLASTIDAIRGVIVTHHHVDHAGTAEDVRSRSNATVYVNSGDTTRVEGDDPSHPPEGFYREVWRPSMIRYLSHTVAFGGASYRPVAETARLAPGPLDLPGRPQIVESPGHTAGHCSVYLPSRGVLLTGDAMVNFDYATGETGLGLHRFNENRAQARASLDRFEGLEAETMLFGHGDPWTGGIDSALERARASD